MSRNQVSLLSGRSYQFSRMLGQEELDAIAGCHHEEIGRGQEEHLGMLKSLEDRHVTVSLLVLLFLALSSCSRASRSSGVSQCASLGQSGRCEENQNSENHRRNAPGDVHPLPALHPPKCRIVNRHVVKVSVVPILSK